MFRMKVAEEKVETTMRTFVAVLMSMAMMGCFVPAEEIAKPQDVVVGSSVTGSENADGTCGSIGIIAHAASVQPGSTCVCTRRDAVPTGQGCAKGVGESVTATIDSSGGTLTLNGQQGIASGVPFKLTIPPTALSAPTVIKVTETAMPPPAGMVDWSPVFLVEPVGLVFATPVAMQIPFLNGRGSAQFDSNMSVFWSGQQTCNLARLPSGYVNAGFMTANITRGGYAIVGYAQQGSVPSCN